MVSCVRGGERLKVMGKGWEDRKRKKEIVNFSPPGPGGSLARAEVPVVRVWVGRPSNNHKLFPHDSRRVARPSSCPSL